MVDVPPETFVPALRNHRDAAGFPEVVIEKAAARLAASRTDLARFYRLCEDAERAGRNAFGTLQI